MIVSDLSESLLSFWHSLLRPCSLRGSGALAPTVRTDAAYSTDSAVDTDVAVEPNADGITDTAIGTDTADNIDSTYEPTLLMVPSVLTLLSVLMLIASLTLLLTRTPLTILTALMAPTALTAHVQIFIGKPSSFPAKQEMHLHILFPPVALRIRLVTKCAAFPDFSVGLRMFSTRRLSIVPVYARYGDKKLNIINYIRIDIFVNEGTVAVGRHS